MDQWTKIIKYGGSVALVSLLLYTVINYLFTKEIIELFGSDRFFLILVLLIVSLLVILLISIVYKSKEASLKSSNTSNGPQVTYKDRSTHNGDNNF